MCGAVVSERLLHIGGAHVMMAIRIGGQQRAGIRTAIDQLSAKAQVRHGMGMEVDKSAEQSRRLRAQHIRDAIRAVENHARQVARQTREGITRPGRNDHAARPV